MEAWGNALSFCQNSIASFHIFSILTPDERGCDAMRCVAKDLRPRASALARRVSDAERLEKEVLVGPRPAGREVHRGEHHPSERHHLARVATDLGRAWRDLSERGVRRALLQCPEPAESSAVSALSASVCYSSTHETRTLKRSQLSTHARARSASETSKTVARVLFCCLKQCQTVRANGTTLFEATA